MCVCNHNNNFSEFCVEIFYVNKNNIILTISALSFVETVPTCWTCTTLKGKGRERERERERKRERERD